MSVSSKAPPWNGIRDGTGQDGTGQDGTGQDGAGGCPYQVATALQKGCSDDRK